MRHRGHEWASEYHARLRTLHHVVDQAAASIDRGVLAAWVAATHAVPDGPEQQELPDEAFVVRKDDAVARLACALQAMHQLVETQTAELQLGSLVPALQCAASQTQSSEVALHRPSAQLQGQAELDKLHQRCKVAACHHSSGQRTISSTAELQQRLRCAERTVSSICVGFEELREVLKYVRMQHLVEKNWGAIKAKLWAPGSRLMLRQQRQCVFVSEGGMAC